MSTPDHSLSSNSDVDHARANHVEIHNSLVINYLEFVYEQQTIVVYMLQLRDTER